MKSWIRFCGKKEQSQKSIVVRNRTHLEKLRGDEAVNFSSLLNVNLKKTDKEIKYAIIIILIIYFCCCSLTPNATLRETPCNQTRKKHQEEQIQQKSNGLFSKLEKQQHTPKRQSNERH